jgi:hypothetical protein
LAPWEETGATDQHFTKMGVAKMSWHILANNWYLDLMGQQMGFSRISWQYHWNAERMIMGFTL